ncbi:hypothetical protein Pla123a_44420 [Posidoniimonas polymericola]|uniref:Uncharacterized protein n=1 Tax=Posidoniimonas polymericola TaxID=2528002 RepID=A0A5C5XXD0_9BACT|nr:hypothetical protein [Posidoniimonas polymericola]TWT67013.1 hypothetical protein Pla123a_44420 [Posidoniimonas polymericola]
MTQRERVLLIGVILTLALWGGWKGLQWRQQAMSDLRSEQRALDQQLAAADLERLKTQRDIERLEQWQQQSLPADTQVAQTEYRAWLMDQLNEAGLSFNNVRRVGARPEGSAYTSITYTAHAEGKVPQLTKFLYSFYRSAQLHKLTRLKLDPLPDGGAVAMDITVESLIVDGTTRKEGLSEGESDRLALGELADYLASIEGRNVFVEYTPPPPPKKDPPPQVAEKRPEPPPKPKFDDAKHAHFTAVVGKGDAQQAWINVRTTGKTLYVSEGDAIKVGQFDGTVKSIDAAARRLYIESEGKVYGVPFGASLSEGEPIDGDTLL